MLNHKLDHFCKVNINGYSTHIGEHCLPNNIFFFQAEDGIRDDLATGVQTCALPIWNSSIAICALLSSSPEIRWPPILAKLKIFFRQNSAAKIGSSQISYPRSSMGAEPRESFYDRSEERRVGKESRCMWGK